MEYSGGPGEPSRTTGNPAANADVPSTRKSRRGRDLIDRDVPTSEDPSRLSGNSHRTIDNFIRIATESHSIDVKQIEKENKDYDYNEDKEKLYFKLFREWYAINLNNIGRDIVEEGSFKIIEEILKDSSIYTEKYLENKKFLEDKEKNNITFDYNFDYIEVLNRMYKNLEEKEKEEHFKILEDMINEKRINVKNEIGKRGYVIYRNKNYMMLNKKDNEYRNVITFMHELRSCYGK